VNELAARLRGRWGLVNDGAFPLSRRSVEPVRRADGGAAVLRLAPAGDLELAAAEWFGGRGAPRVLEIDHELGAVLLERVRPGTMLDAEPEEAVVPAAASVMRALWRAPDAGCPFPTVRDWGAALEPGSRAAGLYVELCDSSADAVVLHGDLHHFNVLRSGDGWVAIDPKGVVGEREYEVGALLRNPWSALLDEPRPGRILERRSTQLAEALGFDLERVRAWAYVQAVLAAAWCVEDGWDPAFPLAVADLLEPLTRARTAGPGPPR
jgi:streptomycin 6-kinase